MFIRLTSKEIKWFLFFLKMDLSLLNTQIFFVKMNENQLN